MAQKMAPVHPGEILQEDFMKPLGLTQYALAKALRVEPLRISQIVRGQRAVTPDTALRLARYFGTSPQVWLRLQADYDLEVAKDQIEDRILQEVDPR
ncbi:MAG TPA: HigA family addiction module antitoxin [Candidatus Bipolaricaulota bacterium]